jgi:hypothetical protein
MITEEQLIERDSKRDIWAELLVSVRQMKAEQVGAVHQVKVFKMIEARQKVGFSQRQFACIHTLADFVQFRNILLRKGSLTPREDDELSERTTH